MLLGGFFLYFISYPLGWSDSGCNADPKLYKIFSWIGAITLFIIVFCVYGLFRIRPWAIKLTILINIVIIILSYIVEEINRRCGLSWDISSNILRYVCIFVIFIFFLPVIKSLFSENR
jgi:small-conductance mechanosensitive channel